MSATTASSRIIASIEGDEDGPSLVCTAGLHGNERAAVEAARSAAAELAGTSFRGRVLFLQGNLAAYAEGKRFLDADLNRLWTEERMAMLAAGEILDNGIREEAEQQELYALIQEFFSSAGGEKYILDLHGSSSFSQPFCVITDPGVSYGWALQLDIPCVIWKKGDAAAQGALIAHGARCGYPSIVIEAGPLTDDGTAPLIEACVWQSLAATGMVQPDGFNQFEAHCRLLAQCRNGVPQTLEIIYEHLIEPSDGFRMEPGFVNFQEVQRGQLLGRDRRGPVYADDDCHVLFPLYQEKSDYGFLLTRTA